MYSVQNAVDFLNDLIMTDAYPLARNPKQLESVAVDFASGSNVLLVDSRFADIFAASMKLVASSPSTLPSTQIRPANAVETDIPHRIPLRSRYRSF